MSGTEEKFEEEKFMKILVNLKDTQESIQGFSSWCIKNRKSAYKMARCWIKVIKKVRIEQKLVLFYLVNDIVQVFPVITNVKVVTVALAALGQEALHRAAGQVPQWNQGTAMSSQGLSGRYRS